MLFLENRLRTIKSGYTNGRTTWKDIAALRSTSRQFSIKFCATQTMWRQMQKFMLWQSRAVLTASYGYLRRTVSGFMLLC